LSDSSSEDGDFSDGTENDDEEETETEKQAETKGKESEEGTEEAAEGVSHIPKGIKRTRSSVSSSDDDTPVHSAFDMNLRKLGLY